MTVIEEPTFTPTGQEIAKQISTLFEELTEDVQASVKDILKQMILEKELLQNVNTDQTLPKALSGLILALTYAKEQSTDTIRSQIFFTLKPYIGYLSKSNESALVLLYMLNDGKVFNESDCFIVLSNFGYLVKHQNGQQFIMRAIETGVFSPWVKKED